MTLSCLYEKHDKLHDFAERFLASRPIGNLFPGPGLDPGLDFGGVRTAVLHVAGRFQVEAVMVAPYVVIPDHTHPNVDTIEYPLAGLLRLTFDGADLFPALDDAAYPRMAWRVAVRIDRNQVHGGKAGPAGALFLSIQRWDVSRSNAGCRHVGCDWQGATVSPAHAALAGAADA